MQHARIASIGAYVPERRMHNDELAEFIDTSDEWIYSHTGIRYRHVAADEQSASDLAVPAAQQAIERAGLETSDIDLILLATSTPDFIGLPSTACVVQDRLDIRDAGAMDVVAACSGFSYALETARVYVTSGATKHVLVVGAEVYSKIVNWKDRRSCVLFGDGAGAVVVSATDDPNGGRVLPSILGSQGSGAETLFRSHGGTRYAYVPGETAPEELLLKMDGRKVYNFAVSSMGFAIREVLAKNDLSIEDIDRIIPHQANKRIIDATAKREKWDPDLFYVNIDEYANTSAASIPIALNEMYEKGMLRRGGAYLTVGFGSGLTYGGNVFYF
jgi:3-oxoacyl-[acyl-carrier-protein] synthase-3